MDDARTIHELIASAPANRFDFDQVSPYALQAFAEAGLFWTSPAAQGPVGLEDLRQWLDFAGGEKKNNAVFMDTTTLTAAPYLIARASHLLTPVTLFDLGTLVTNVTIYDRVFHFRGPQVDDAVLNKAIGDDVFVPITMPRLLDDIFQGASRALGDLWDETNSYLSDLRQRAASVGVCGQEVRSLQAGWTKVLGREISIDDLLDPMAPDAQVATQPGHLGDLVRATDIGGERVAFGLSPLDESKLDLLPDARDPSLLRRTVSMCNHRSYFNHRVSAMLKLPYAPNTARLPLRDHLYRRATVIHEALATVTCVEDEYRRLADGYHAPRQDNLQLPVFLAALLSRIQTLDEFYGELSRLREKAKQFRSHRAELDQAIERGDVQTCKQIREALESDTRVLRNLVGFPVIMGAIGAILPEAAKSWVSLGHSDIVAGLAFLAGAAAADALKSVPASALAKLKRRLLEPQYWFLTDTAASAKALTSAWPKVRQLWKLDDRDQQAFADRFEHLGELRYG